MSEPASKHKHPLVAQGWGNCPKCGYFYKQSKLDDCPMCHHPWRLIVGYQQPAYEPPTLGP